MGLWGRILELLSYMARLLQSTSYIRRIFGASRKRLSPEACIGGLVKFSFAVKNLEAARAIQRRCRGMRKAIAVEPDAVYADAVREYWRRHVRVSGEAHLFYASLNGLKDVRYLSDAVFFAAVEPALNRMLFVDAIDDKNYYSDRFPGAPQPPTLVRGVSGLISDSEFRHLSAAEALEVCAAQDEVVVKPSIGSMAGDLVHFLRPAEIVSVGEFREILAGYRGNFIVQAVLRQHSTLRAFNPTSVNTLRLMTLLVDGESVLLSAILRVGGPGSRVDNHAKGGIFCGITKTGNTKEHAFGDSYALMTKGPTGGELCNVQIPSFAEAVTMVKHLHRRHGHFRIISWDVAIGEDGRPLLIEFNLARQAIDMHQVANGPLLGDLTGKILSEVFGSASGRKLAWVVSCLDRLP